MGSSEQILGTLAAIEGTPLLLPLPKTTLIFTLRHGGKLLHERTTNDNVNVRIPLVAMAGVEQGGSGEEAVGEAGEAEVAKNWKVFAYSAVHCVGI